MTPLLAYLGLILVGIVWGLTDILMKTEVDKNESKPTSKDKNFMLRLLLNWKWSCYLIINRIASISLHYFTRFVGTI